MATSAACNSRDDGSKAIYLTAQDRIAREAKAANPDNKMQKKKRRISQWELCVLYSDVKECQP